jgi:hypothetical protein
MSWEFPEKRGGGRRVFLEAGLRPGFPRQGVEEGALRGQDILNDGKKDFL